MKQRSNHERGIPRGLASLFVLIRSKNPDERLDVNHIPRSEIANVILDGTSKLKQAPISLPGRFGLIFEVKLISLSGGASDVRLEKYVLFRLGYESEDR